MAETSWDQFPAVESEPAGDNPWDAFPAVEDAKPTGVVKADAGGSSKPGKLASVGRGAAQGLTFGLADEGYGAIRGIGSMIAGDGYGAGYEKGVTEYREGDAAAKKENPWSFAGGEIGGSVPVVLGAGATALGAKALGLVGRSLFTRSAASASSGAAIGAFQGANNAEGGVVERTKAAWLPAATGGAIGAVSPTLGIAMGKVANLLAVRRAQATRGSLPAGTPAPAVDMLADDFAAAGGSQAVRQRMNELGPQAMLLDASPGLQGRAQGLAVLPETRDVVMKPIITRAQGTNARLRGDLDASIGPSPVPSQVEAGLAQSREVVGELYGPVMAKARAVDTASLAARLEADAINLRGPQQRAVKQVRDMLDIPGNPGTLDPNPQALLSTRQAIDGLLEGETNSKVLGALKAARKEVDARLQFAAPGIKDVDAQYQELARQSEGLTRGAQVLDSGRTAPRPSEVANEITKAVTPEGQLVGPSASAFRIRQGLRAEIDRQVGTKANDLVALRNVVKGEGDWNRAKLAQVFGDGPADQILASVDREAAFESAYRNIVANSQTAMRSESAAAVKPRAGTGGNGDMGTVIAGAAGGPLAAAGAVGMKGVRLAGEQVAKAADLARNEWLSTALVETRGPRLERLIRMVEGRIGIKAIGDTAEAKARDLSQILISSQGYQGSKAVPEGLRPQK